MKNVAINNEFLEAIKLFTSIDEKPNILQSIDTIIEINVRSGFAEEYQLGAELGILYDLKRLVETLPFTQPQ